MLASLRRTMRGASLVLLALLIVTPLVQIVMRGIFNVPMAGAEELARYFLICLCFLAACNVTAEGGQIRMEEFQVFLPPRGRWLLQVVIEASAVGLFAVLLFASITTIANNLDNQTATLEMPFWLFMGPLALGALLLSIESLVTLIATWRAHHAHEKQTTLT
jgi:TRAP-type C4-dicarboxylate transport system permease small subunit